jgi:hypothetical protein
MSRARERVCLQDGLKLDLNRLARQGFVRRGARSGPTGIRWSSIYWDQELTSGIITADMSGNHEGWLGLQLGNLEQSFTLVAQPRPFGGLQWYFTCPVLNRSVSVLWRPPGARDFRSRQAWGRQVAYASQFIDQINRAHLGKSRIKRRLIADLDPDEWDLPPKPKWMRWSTYNRYVERYDKYEAFLNYGCAATLARLLGKISFEK